MLFWASAIALSHPLNFSVDCLSCLLIVLVVVMGSSEYKRAYETAKLELAELLVTQDRLEKRKLELRKTIETLATLCEVEEIEVDSSKEQEYLLENSTLADEIRSILRGYWGRKFRPNEIKSELTCMGHDLSKYRNPQASIHMVLKRMVESKEVLESTDAEGKQVYGWKLTLQEMAGKTIGRNRAFRGAFRNR